jgi:hypothetical protein
LTCQLEDSEEENTDSESMLITKISCNKAHEDVDDVK